MIWRPGSGSHFYLRAFALTIPSAWNSVSSNSCMAYFLISFRFVLNFCSFRDSFFAPSPSGPESASDYSNNFSYLIPIHEVSMRYRELELCDCHCMFFILLGHVSWFPRAQCCRIYLDKMCISLITKFLPDRQAGKECGKDLPLCSFYCCSLNIPIYLNNWVF